MVTLSMFVAKMREHWLACTVLCVIVVYGLVGINDWVRLWDKHGGLIAMSTALCAFAGLSLNTVPDGDNGTKQVGWILGHCHGPGDIALRDMKLNVQIPTGLAVTSVDASLEGYPTITTSGMCVHTRPANANDRETIRTVQVTNPSTSLTMQVRLHLAPPAPSAYATASAKRKP